MEYFFTFKSLLFIYDFWQELGKKDCFPLDIYRETFENIKEIHDTFNLVRYLLASKDIRLKTIQLKGIGLSKKKSWHSLSEFISKLEELPLKSDDEFNQILSNDKYKILIEMLPFSPEEIDKFSMKEKRKLLGHVKRYLAYTAQ